MTISARALRSAIALVALSVSTFAVADTEVGNGCIAHFASAEEGAEILGKKDAYIERQSPFDRSARMKTDRAVSTTEFLAFVRANVVEWNDSEKAQLAAVIAKLRPSLERLNLPLPARVSLIKTTGAEEGNAFYTRDNAIVFPRGQLQNAKAPLAHVIPHELFHIASRRNPGLREALYNAIGFTRCPEVTLPPELANRKLTNPDAPANDHAIKLKSNGSEVTAVPLIFSSSATYNVARGGEFFDYLKFGFIPLRRGRGPTAEILKRENVSGFFEQVGRNTEYVIHPEEILADNFALLVQKRSGLPSPEVVQRIRAVLSQHSGAGKPR
jgi:hypothetical protein